MPESTQSLPAPLLNPKEAARILDISTRTLNRLVKRGDIAFVRVGGSLRFKPADLADFINQNRVRGND